MASPKIEVLGLGAPIADQILRVNEDFLQFVEGEKGGSRSVDHETLISIMNKAKEKAVTTPGGSAANTIIALNALGTKTALAGMIGKDEMGSLYRERLIQRGIVPFLTENETEATAQVLSLVTPDGQRTMRCFLGASCGFNESHLNEKYFESIKLLHCEGYALYNGDGEVVKEAMAMAKNAGAKVSLDLASFEVVRRYKDTIMRYLEEYVDIVFCNEDEAKVINPGGTVDETAQILASLCQVAVVTLGPKGCLVASGSQRIHCPTTPITCVDTTGAGDIFASGFLHSYLQGCSLRECCRVAHLLGGAVLRIVGAQLPDSAWEDILREIKEQKSSDIAHHNDLFLLPNIHIKQMA